MEHRCKVTVIDKKLYPELQAEYCAVPDSGKCPCYNVGDEFLFYRNDEHDDYWHCGAGTLVKAGEPDEGHRALRKRGRPILLGSVGCYQPIYLYGPAGWKHHARLDERRPGDDRLLQRRHETGHLQDRADRR